MDVAAFALRIALWSLKRPRPQAVMVMDEPFRFLFADLQDKAAVMLKEISQRLGIQFLIVTHEENLLAAGDKTFHATNQSGTTRLT